MRSIGFLDLSFWTENIKRCTWGGARLEQRKFDSQGVVKIAVKLELIFRSISYTESREVHHT